MRGILVALAVAACARDFSVPPPSQRPVITSFSPTSGFADVILTIKGKNFDPIAANNLVQFAGTTSRAYDHTAAGDLLVQVPESTYAALDGPIAVSTSAGTSDPSAASFAYQGRGHPFLGTQVGTTRFLHRPPGIGLLAGEVVLASTAAWAALGSNGFFAALPGEPTAFAGLPDGSAAFAAAGGKVAGVAGARPVVDLGAVTVRFLSAAPGSLHLAAASEDPLGVVHVVGLAPADLTKSGERLLTTALLGLAALDDGRAAAVDASGVTIVDPASSSSQRVLAPAPLAGPIAATSAGLVAAFADGSIRVLALGSSTWGAPITTGSLEPFAALIDTGGGVVAGAKPVEGVVRTVDSGTGTIVAEHAFTGRPHALFWNGAQILVADDASNAVEAMDPDTGAIATRSTFPLGLGSSMGCGQGAGVQEDQGAGYYHYRFLAAAPRLNQLQAIDYNSLVTQAPVRLAQGTSPLRGIAMSDPKTVFVVHQTEIGELRTDDTEQILTSALPGAQCLLFPDPAGAAVVVLTANGVSVLRGSEVTGTVTLPGPIVSGGVRPDGAVVIFFGDAARPGASPQARLYTVDAIEHGGPPAAHFAGAAGYQGFIGAFESGWGPMLFFTWDAVAQAPGSFAVVLDDSLAAKPAVATGITEAGVLRLTPDGYYFAWRREASGENVLRIASGIDVTAIYPYSAYRLDGAPAAFAFDSSGEYMYVPIPDQDEIETFQ